MIKLSVRLNLDLYGERWPTELPSVPRIGDYIQSSTRHGIFQLHLEVVSVTWQRGREGWYPEIELHVPKKYNMSITKFYEWYAPLVGRSLAAFI